ncbi:MAG: acyl-CoA thioesterase [Proteobacteria bacterium]|nr:acyl-CoA thioesterase [Pseudomonadota bacterium]
MEAKKAGESQVVMTHVMMPQDANPAGNVHGGVIMKHIDNAAGVVATRHTRSNVVTASLDRLDFYHPVYIGNLLTLKASINLVGRTSMEIGVRVETEDLVSGQIRKTASAYLTYVALDEHGRHREVPALILESAEELRRNREAIARRATRLAEKKKEKQCQQDLTSCPNFTGSTAK